MKEKILKKFLVATFLVLLAASVTAGAFTVDEPDGTSDSTSGYYTITWTPTRDWGIQSMTDVNNVSCYADIGNTVYNKTYTIGTGIGSDDNAYRFDLFGWAGRSESTQYYVWCMNDLNSDMNDYSGGQLTLTPYNPRDIGPISIDAVGGILDAIAQNMGLVASILVIIIIVVFLVDLITGVFGIITTIREVFKKR